MNNHELLGVAIDASSEDIELAYKRARMQSHPDRGGDPAMFDQIQKAYQALKNRVCSVCDGKGFITTRQGFFSIRSNCPVCWKK